MASADFSQQALLHDSDFFSYSMSVRPPRVRAITFPSSICHIYMAGFGQYWTLLCMASSSVPPCLICDFCSSDRGFASGFLQIPPRGGHPCPWLTVPTAKPVADFHRQVIAHAGRTMQKSSWTIMSRSFFIWLNLIKSAVLSLSFRAFHTLHAL